MNYKQLNKIIINNHLIKKNDLISDSTTPIELKLFLKEWFNENNFIVVKTSGSTGKPKEIKLNKQHIVNSAICTCAYLKLNEKDIFLLSLPINFIGGIMVIIRAMVSQSNLIYISPSKNPLININKDITFIAVTPYQFSFMMNESIDKVKKIKTIIIGGAPISIKIENQIKKLPNSIYSTFGMTETISHIALKLIKDNDFYNILAPTNITVNKKKQLIINSPHLGINNLITNDVVELLSETTFKWIGRKDNVINSGGIKIYPEEIEKEIKKSMDDIELMVTSISHATLGNEIILLVNSTKFQALKKVLQTLPKYHRPKKLVIANCFVYNSNKKLLRIDTKKRMQDFPIINI